jgi:threonylcarbamoyladenosine tRNA methylthiotransferase MtaB
MLKVAFHTFGCRANQYDTEMMKAQLGNERVAIVPEGAAADVYIINTCAVTRRAENKARQYVRHLAHASKNPLVLVTGCYAEVAAPEIAEVEGVSLVFNNAGKAQVRELLRAVVQGERGFWKARPARTLDDEQITTDTAHTRAFVKIQDGCDQFCTFCKTVYARGRPRDKSLPAIVREVKDLVANGYPEIVFTGINIAQYGESTGTRLSEVLAAVAAIPRLMRIRLSSINLSGVTADLIDWFAGEPKACPHFHIPLQSGDDAVLHRMRRRHTTADYRRAVENIRTCVSKATFGTDLLVGFPGETDEQCEKTCRFVEEIGFANVHLFRYSRRPGTAAAFFTDQIPPPVKRARAARLRRVVTRVTRRVKQAYVGTELEVLIEGRVGEDGRPRGYSENYFDVHLLRSKEARRGELVRVHVQATRQAYLLAEVIASAGAPQPPGEGVAA